LIFASKTAFRECHGFEMKMSILSQRPRHTISASVTENISIGKSDNRICDGAENGPRKFEES